MNEEVNTLEQFNMQSHFIREQNLYLDLINNRDNRINDKKHKQTVLLGYYKLMNFINKRLVREAASNQVVVK